MATKGCGVWGAFQRVQFEAIFELFGGNPLAIIRVPWLC